MIAFWNRKLVFTTYKNEEFVCASNALKQQSIDYKVKVKSMGTAASGNGTVAADIMMEKDQKSAFYYLYVNRKNFQYASEIIHRAIHS